MNQLFLAVHLILQKRVYLFADGSRSIRKFEHSDFAIESGLQKVLDFEDLGCFAGPVETFEGQKDSPHLY